MKTSKKQNQADEIMNALFSKGAFHLSEQTGQDSQFGNGVRQVDNGLENTEGIRRIGVVIPSSLARSIIQ